jgi:hypothetical protein
MYNFHQKVTERGVSWDSFAAIEIVQVKKLK